MAYLRLGNIKENTGPGGKAKGLQKCIDYILNDRKTNNGSYVSAHNMLLTSNNKGKEAFDTMVDTKKRFCKEEGRQGYHFKLSFSEKDPITPDLAMKITARFCEEVFPDNECIYAVHDNTKHMHSHIVINSIDMIEGRKYHYKKGDWAKVIQPKLNEICKEKNLSAIDLSMDEDFILSHKCKVYNRWELKGKTEIYYTNAMIKADVDALVQEAESFDEFIHLMEKKGHKVDVSGKHIKVLAPGRERYTRLYSLTKDKSTYTSENIKLMISGKYLTNEEVQSKLFSEWNSLRYPKLKLTFVRIDLGLLRILEEKSFAEKNNLYTKEDADAYLLYLDRADKELNILKKKITDDLERRKEAVDLMESMMPLFKFYVRYEKGEEAFKKEHDQVKDIYHKLRKNGYSLEALYKYKSCADGVISLIKSYKKHLYVNKIICERVIDHNEYARRKDLSTKETNGLVL